MNSSLQHLNHPLIYKHPDQFFNDSFPLSETGLASSYQNQNEVCSDERGPAELEEWHGIQDTTPEVAASGAESHTDPSSDHRQLPVKPPTGMSELYSPLIMFDSNHIAGSLRYLPPHLREELPTPKGDSNIKLTRQLKGLLNK